MKLIIDISEKVYNEYMNLAKGRIPTYKACDIADVLKNGTPLPTTNKEVIEALFGAMSASTIIERIPNQHWLNEEFKIGG